ncbi:hypothetical protein [Calothrix sp. 336/3]|uniref:hypothetical protein n=1 Tax=Calothrix sp. 336/3 TaxID=1337936 RepID=UPI0004E36DF7|nr:hypothetical protein [Calothrix sp. 336/3]AKG20940.1 hypothetical protein IJ00_06190 [Calothrix sp. 336/3]
MYICSAYNLCIHSETPLPELPKSEGKADIIVRLGKDLDHISRETIDGNQRVLGKIDDIAIFLAEDGRQLTIEPMDGIDESILAPNIAGSMISVLLAQRGLLVLHASSVVINHRAVAFMGGSGWGKSTLAAAFHRQGYSVLTEDVMAVDIVMNHGLVIPSFPQFKLCSESLNSLGQDSNNLPSVFPNGIKLSYRFQDGFRATPLVLERIYVLAKGDRHTITKLRPQEAFLELLRHSFSTSILKSPQSHALHMQQCNWLVKNIPFSRFSRKPSLSELPELVKLVEEDIAAANPELLVD